MHPSPAEPAVARPAGPRLFVSVHPPPEVRDAIAAVGALLRAEAGSTIRWTDPATVHLTLRFLGVTPGDRVVPLRTVLGAAAACVDPVALTIAGAGAFPAPARARVLWLGVRPDPTLHALYRAVDAACADVGLGRESRPFRPHLTIGRPRPGAPSLQAELARVGFVAAARVDSFQLMVSDLTRTGARHTPLASFALGGAAAAPTTGGAR